MVGSNEIYDQIQRTLMSVDRKVNFIVLLQ